jgi:hypothetical protein
MQHCADDTRSMISIATAHSKLQRAAVEALSSVSAGQLDQARLNSLLLYLAKHGQHVRSLVLCAPIWVGVPLHELPPSLTKLDSLQLRDMHLQLQPGLGGTQGVLRAGLPLTRLELSWRSVLDGTQGLTAALAQLLDLRHLHVEMEREGDLVFVTGVLSHLVQLTSLLLNRVDCCNESRASDNTSSASSASSDSSDSDSDGTSSDSDPSAALRPLQALTRLADLELVAGEGITPAYRVTANTLTGAVQLTRLVLTGQLFDSRALAGHCRSYSTWTSFASTKQTSPTQYSTPAPLSSAARACRH